MYLPKHISQKITERKRQNAFRTLKNRVFEVDFYSNDYIGFSTCQDIEKRVQHILSDFKPRHGSTGSRLLSGNYELFSVAEETIRKFHNSQGALLFNSGYDANIGFFSCIAQRGDVILYDSYIHASIRDGISLSLAQSFKFKHNDLDDLQKYLTKFSDGKRSVFVVTESVFSMDGDSPDLVQMSELISDFQAFMVVDEAHALGVFGHKGCGLVQHLKLQDKVFARIVTFGKALGCHGACVLASNEVCHYLINFARSFIYTTAMPPHNLATILAGYHQLEVTQNIEKLHRNITFFRENMMKTRFYAINKEKYIESKSAVQAVIFSGNDWVKSVADSLHRHGFGVMPILSPTIPKGQERLRICLHSFNTQQQISDMLSFLTQYPLAMKIGK